MHISPVSLECRTFADAFLSKLDGKQLDAYDTLLNKPDSDWDIYYWAIGASPMRLIQADIMY